MSMFAVSNLDLANLAVDSAVAIATAAAVGVAVWQTRVAARAARRAEDRAEAAEAAATELHARVEEREHERWLADIVGQQASRVLVTARWTPTQASNHNPQGLCIEILNDSGKPLTDVALFYLEPRNYVLSSDLAPSFDVVFVGERETRLRRATRISTVAPGTSTHDVIAYVSSEREFDPAVEPVPGLVVYFTDFLNNRWGLYPGEQPRLVRLGAVRWGEVGEPNWTEQHPGGPVELPIQPVRRPPEIS